MVLDNLRKYKIILASASPRRQELLRNLGIDFDVVLKPVPEDFPQGMKAEEIALLLSARKAAAFKDEKFPAPTLVITADTVVCMDEEVIGKPAGRQEAIRILQGLSGKKHKVITAVSIMSGNRQVNFAVSTDVYFKTLRAEEIIYYVDHFNPFDKAGAYGIQEWIGYTGVEKIEGSFYNVMGLPVLRLYEELRKF